MIVQSDLVGERLKGKKLFLSASVPTAKRAERYLRIENAHFEIEQAVISLARAVFSESGQLIFGGHPAISPLVAMVAGEYREPRRAESQEERPAVPIRVFQSRVFEGFLPDDTLAMYRLGYATITWVEAEPGEHFDPHEEYAQPPCPGSLHRMRLAMIERTRPDAMVCIGGMDGVEKEFELFQLLQPQAPVFVIERTGGASMILNEKDNNQVRVIDSEVVNRLEEMRSRMETKHREGIVDEKIEPPAVPYPLIMQTIVDELAGSDFQRPGPQRRR